MSHVTTIDLKISDLNALAKACERLGLELKLGQKNFKWYGQYMGDYRENIGVRPADYGKCDHAIAVKNAAKNTYEIGVIREGDSFKLAWDFWHGGHGLVEKISYAGATGKDANKLRDWYAAEVAARQMRKQGFSVKAKQLNGKVQVVCSK